ncbi:hypothetical protein HIM_01561 [Hirsutella minnesotensis 3608]|nr:hypothetical protein HIM_01561 [Hirsutella minnesotensis 3608]
MAPELRKRKAAAEPEKTPAPKIKNAAKTSKPKRKAAEDSSPVSLKKQKSEKPTPSRKSTDTPTKTGKTKKPAKSVPAEEEQDVEPAESDDKGDDDVLLLADELDSADDETVDETALFKPGQDVGKIPAISADVLKKAGPPTGDRGVIYVGRIPHGFYEREMRQYMSQFGPVTRLRLSRNKKTGASRHFAFVEFQDASTAEVVAKTMDNYLLFGHILKVKVVPQSQIHEELFKGANRRFKRVPWNKMAGQKLAKPRSQSDWEAKVEAERVHRAQRADKLKAMGYEFDAPELKDVPAALPAPAADATIEAIEAAPETETGGKEVVEEAVKEAKPDVENSPAIKTKASKKKTSKAGKGKKGNA